MPPAIMTISTIIAIVLPFGRFPDGSLSSLWPGFVEQTRSKASLSPGILPPEPLDIASIAAPPAASIPRLSK
jgi:hypothetical protein